MVAANPNIETLFEHFKKLSGDSVAAASLVLAQVTLDGREKPQTSMLDVTEVACKLGVSGKTIRRLIDSGKLPATKVGAGRGTYRITPEAVFAFQQNNSMCPDDGPTFKNLGV